MFMRTTQTKGPQPSHGVKREVLAKLGISQVPNRILGNERPLSYMEVDAFAYPTLGDDTVNFHRYYQPRGPFSRLPEIDDQHWVMQYHWANTVACFQGAILFHFRDSRPFWRVWENQMGQVPAPPFDPTPYPQLHEGINLNRARKIINNWNLAHLVRPIGLRSVNPLTGRVDIHIPCRDGRGICLVWLADSDTGPVFQPHWIPFTGLINDPRECIHTELELELIQKKLGMNRGPNPAWAQPGFDPLLVNEAVEYVLDTTMFITATRPPVGKRVGFLGTDTPTIYCPGPDIKHPNAISVAGHPTMMDGVLNYFIGSNFPLIHAHPKVLLGSNVREGVYLFTPAIDSSPDRDYLLDGSYDLARVDVIYSDNCAFTLTTPVPVCFDGLRLQRPGLPEGLDGKFFFSRVESAARTLSAVIEDKLARWHTVKGVQMVVEAQQSADPKKYPSKKSWLRARYHQLAKSGKVPEEDRAILQIFLNDQLQTGDYTDPFVYYDVYSKDKRAAMLGATEVPAFAHA